MTPLVSFGLTVKYNIAESGVLPIRRNKTEEYLLAAIAVSMILSWKETQLNGNTPAKEYFTFKDLQGEYSHGS